MANTTRTETDLVNHLEQLQAAPDGRWDDIVMDLVDTIAHATASDAVNAGGSYDDEHDQADITRTSLHSAAPGTVAAWLIAQLGESAVWDELDMRSL